VNSLIWLGLTIAGTNEALIQKFGLHPAHWTIITSITHMFLHAGLWHVLGNMWFFWMFAPKVEEKLGHGLFLIFYLISGFAAAGMHTLFSLGSPIPLVGASGAISGVAGLYFVFFPRSPFSLQLYFGWWWIKSWNAQTRGAVGVWIGEQFLLGLITSTLHSAGIAFWAHIGGFICGFGLAALVVGRGSTEEQEAALHPKPLTEEEKDEIFADRVEQPSDLTTLKLGS
jgi:membrane associated rhomboid family serine protease